MTEQEVIATMWLTTVFGYGTKYPIELIKEFGSAYNVAYQGRTDLLFGDLSDNAKKAMQKPDFSYAEHVYKACQKDGVSILCIQDENYPKLLKEIPNPPAVLYYRGNLDLLHQMTFTVVGTRKTDKEGQMIINDFVPELQRAGFTIVSGFAEGAEAYLHRNYNKTVAVLPCGINVNYPVSNMGLKRKIVENGGLVITEFMHDGKAFRGNFYLRNRLLAALSHGVLVTQAGLKSGTSITATAAGDFGRQVFAVPGSVYNPRFKGCIDMIRNGATAVQNAEQITYEYSQIYDSISAPLVAKQYEAGGVLNLMDSKYNDLDDTQMTILKCISGNRVHADEIAVRTGIDISIINANLVMLELDEMIVRLDGNLYMIK